MCIWIIEKMTFGGVHVQGHSRGSEGAQCDERGVLWAQPQIQD